MSTSAGLDDPRHIAGEPAPQTSGKPVPPLSQTRAQSDEPQALQSRPKRVLAVLQVLMLIGAIGASSYAMYTVATWPSDSDNMDSNQNELLVRTEGRDADAVCIQGGSLILIGTDQNLNGYLDGVEVTSTTNLCHGERGFSGLQGIAGTSTDGATSRIETTNLPVGNETCMSGGLMIESGIDSNHDQSLNESEVASTEWLCNGALGSPGFNGGQGADGIDGTTGASALVSQRDPLPSVCAAGVVIDFGIDNGRGDGVAGDEVLHEDEALSSLKICSQELFVGPIGDYNTGMSDGISSSCEQLMWMPTANLLLTAGSDGSHGCELWISDATPTGSVMLIDLNPSGDGSPGRFAGFTLINIDGRELVVFDADDGVNGRHLWSTDGTLSGTQRIQGNISTSVTSSTEVVMWNEGLVVLNNPDGLLWTNGTVAMNAFEHPSLSPGLSPEHRMVADSLASYQPSLLFVEHGWLWFAAKTQAGIEPYALHSSGTFQSWDLVAGDAEPSAAIDVIGGVVVVANGEQGRQLVRLTHDGSELWLTTLIHSGTGDPTEHVGQRLGLHRLGDVIVFDALTSGVDPQLWAHDLTQATTTLLSSTILAPGDWAGGVVHQQRLWFDCVAPNIAQEVCSTDGTVAGTQTETDLRAGAASALVRGFVAIESALFMVASGQINGIETGSCLWTLDSINGPSLVYDPWPGQNNNSNSGTYGKVHASNHHVFFIANDGENGHEWHAYSHDKLGNEWLIWSA